MCSAYRIERRRANAGANEPEADILPEGEDEFLARPGGDIPVMAQGGEIAWMRWGFARSFRSVIHNARGERLNSGMWAESLARGRRCAIPLTAWYEWTVEPNGRRQAHILESPGSGLLWVAGLWEEMREKTGDKHQGARAASMVTTAAIADVASIHHRMPAILQKDQIDAWLHAARPPELAAPTLRVQTTPCASPLRRTRSDETPEGNPIQPDLFPEI